MRTWKCRNLLAGLLLAVLLLTACASSAAKAAKKIELGQKYLTEMNYTEAVASFTEAIKLEPDNIQAYIGRAEAYMALGEYDKALEDYQFVSSKTEKLPYTRALSYIGQAEVYEKTDKPEKAISDYELAKALLSASDAGKEEDVSEEDVGVKLVQVLYAHAALCENIKSYDKTLDDYNELLELGEKVEKKRDELLSQLGDSIDEENSLPGTEDPETGETAPEPDTEELADENAAEEEPAPEQEASSASESQKPADETKKEEPASSSEQPADTEAAASSQEPASSQAGTEKNDWVSYSVKVNLGDVGPISETLTVKYCVGEKKFDVHYASEWRSEIYQIDTLNKITYHLSEPLLSAERMEKDFYGYTIFYVPEGTTVNATGEWIQSETESGVKKPDDIEKLDSNSGYLYWIEMDKPSSHEEVVERAYNKGGVQYKTDVTIHSGKVYYMIEPTDGGWASDNVAFCVG